MNSLRAIAIVGVCFITSSATTSFAEAPKLCGDINTIQPTPLAKAPYQFKFDSDLPDVYLLPSPDGRYVVVMRHGACDSTYFGIWDRVNKRAYGDETSLTHMGICWDPREPVVYFSSSDEDGDVDSNGLFKWEFEKRPNDALRIDNPSAVIKMFKKDAMMARLMAIDPTATDLLINVEYIYNSDTIEEGQTVDRLYIYRIPNQRFILCKDCTVENWLQKGKRKK